MQKPACRSEKKLWYYPLRGLVLFAVLFIIKSLTTPRLASFVEDGSGLPSQLFYGFALLAVLLIYNSLVHSFTFYDIDSFARFRERELTEVSFFNELAFILKSKDFWLETLPVVIFSAIFSLIGGFYEAAYTVFPSDNIPTYAFTLLPLASVPLLLLLTSLLCRYEIHRYWAELYRKGEENKVENKAKFAFKILLILAMYPLIFPYAPYVLFVIVTFFGIVGALISLLSVLGFIAAVLAVWFGLAGLMKWKVYRMKKSFLKKLCSLSEEKGEELCIFSKDEREVRGCDFTLSSAGRFFSCKIIHAQSRSTPLYFTPSDAYFLHRIGTKEHHASIERHFDYSFPAEGVKLLVIMKFPKKLFVCEHGATRRLYPGDRIWSYIILDERSFLGEFDRECLYRSNDDNR